MTYTQIPYGFKTEQNKRTSKPRYKIYKMQCNYIYESARDGKSRNIIVHSARSGL